MPPARSVCLQVEEPREASPRLGHLHFPAGESAAADYRAVPVRSPLQTFSPALPAA